MKQSLRTLSPNLETTGELGRSVNIQVGISGKTWAMKGEQFHSTRLNRSQLTGVSYTKIG